MKKRFIPLIMLTSLLLLSFNAPNFFGVIRHDVEIEKYRELGRRPEFSCVGRYSTSETSTEYAAGVLISSKWVLTAAHFVKDSSVWKFGDNFYKTKQIVKHPKLQPNEEETQWTGWDMALVKLETPVLDIKPAKRYCGNEELGKIITELGYGFSGNGKKGLSKLKKQEKLGGQNTADAIGGIFEGRKFSTNVIVCDFDDPENQVPNHFGSPTPLELEIGGAKGDSGGGVFMDDNGTTVLVGIVSGALNRQVKYGSVMALARVSKANEWIESVVD